MSRVYNFSAGPSALPESVLKEAQAHLPDYQSLGYGVMEMSHRSKPFQQITQNAEAALRELMGIGDEYAVLFLQGGASMQFAMVPLNLMNGSGSADYIDSGSFANKAAAEAKKFGTVHVVASSKADGYTHLPAITPELFHADADYVHITTNNTIYGTEYTALPDTGAIPLVADMSSDILGKAYDINRFGLVYAGAQKNIGPAGVTVVIVKKSLMGKALRCCPTMLDYAVHEKEGSLYNTPSCWSIYVSGLVFEWLKAFGGVAAIEQQNRAKAALVYDYLDESQLFRGVAIKEDRSIMNVTFTLTRDELTDTFVKFALSKGLANLKGHRSVGGIRASMYNALPLEGARALVDCMKEFEVANR
ncbi:MAG: 3-phosphoserine/phosphohydroxythreonine transaminase [Eubacteriales bacterium]|nr:3-phosphoserine/phosphohydroxythreonine transaminase [Eubacteriales bacterium]